MGLPLLPVHRAPYNKTGRCYVINGHHPHQEIVLRYFYSCLITLEPENDELADQKIEIQDNCVPTCNARVAKNLTSPSSSVQSFSSVGFAMLGTSSCIAWFCLSIGIIVSRDFATLNRILGIGSLESSMTVGSTKSLIVLDGNELAIV